MPAWTRWSGGVDVIADEPGRSHDAGGVVQFRQHDGQVSGRQRQRPAVDDAPDLREQHVAQPGHPARDDDEPWVEEADETGEHLAYPSSAVPDELDRHRVALRG